MSRVGGPGPRERLHGSAGSIVASTHTRLIHRLIRQDLRENRIAPGACMSGTSATGNAARGTGPVDPGGSTGPMGSRSHGRSAIVHAYGAFRGLIGDGDGPGLGVGR